VKGNKTEKEESVKSETNTQGKKKLGRKEGKTCNKCKWYDWTTERDFHRKVGPLNERGERTEIMELRAICRNKKAKSYGHLVMAEYKKRQCPVWEEGIYEPLKKEKKKNEAKEEEMTHPASYHGPELTDVEKAELKKKRSKKRLLKQVTVRNPQNDDAKTFEQKGRRLVLVKQ